MIAPPQTTNHPLVGTAFDYLLRFYVKRLNPKATDTKWIAECVVERGFFDSDKRRGRKANAVVAEARERYTKYLRTGRVGDELLRSLMMLAQLDPLSRGYVPEFRVNSDGAIVPDFSFTDPSLADIRDLRRLLSVVPPHLFRAKRVCLLNPTFGEASRLVGGADADLVIDGVLVDIKTTKRFRIAADVQRQILGYYILSRLGRVDRMPRRNRITRLGIYFARHGYLWTVNVKDIVDDRRLSTFAKWFVNRARKEFGT